MLPLGSPRGGPLRILLVTFGPINRPRGGITVRAHVSAFAFERLGCGLIVASTGEDAEEPGATRSDGMKRRVVQPARRPRFGLSREFIGQIAMLLGEADVVVVSSALLLPSIVLARVKAGWRSGRRPIVWDTTELETLHYARLRPRTARTVARLASWWVLELTSALIVDTVVAISEEEAGHWRRLFPPARRKTRVVPHAPMPTRLNQAEDEPAPPTAREHAAGDPVVVYVGNARAKQNAAAMAWICTVLAPQLEGRARVVLIGTNSDTVAAEAGAPGNVDALGFVDDIDAELDGATLAIAPMTAAAGVKTKVLQYLSAGLPVIGTPTAFEGLTGVPGAQECDLEEFGAEVIAALSLIEDPEAATSRRTAQRQFVELNHGASSIDPAWHEVLTEVLTELLGGVRAAGADPRAAA